MTSNSHIVVTNAQEVEDLYDDPAAFWDAGWHRVVEHDGQVLLTRALDPVIGLREIALTGPRALAGAGILTAALPMLDALHPSRGFMQRRRGASYLGVLT